jgi:rRNA maturation endonuclease Nob1
MAEPEKRCMVCAKVVAVLKGGICDPCQEKIRREAMGEQARASETADHELSRHGVMPKK